MRLFSVTCLAALSASNLVSAGSWFGASDVTVNEAQKVPGESPLRFCDGDRSQDIVHIEKVDLSPNPPMAGTDLVIHATGTVSQTIEKGAYVKLVVKYGLIRLISTTADLCEQVENVDLECPIEKGVLSITKAVAIPKEVPPGTYNVFADVYNEDDTPITCLQASVSFTIKRNDAESVEDVGDL